ncbi:MAG TPA: CPBP family intramembrane glutamic endopeptidase [Candidatus Paceibacterota bacterium]
MDSLRKSKYSIAVVTIWAFVTVYFFFFTIKPFSYYNFNVNDLILFFPIAICAFASLFVVNHFLNFGKITINKKSLVQILLIFFYAFVLIALPEEIVFRGFIQKNLQLIISNTSLLIVSSSIIFGIVHIPNGARGFLPREWNWKLVAMSFVAGLFLGIAYFMTNSLVIPTILHALLAITGKIFIEN